jgi:hypothetical protein
MITTREVQEALAAAGYNPGPIDGIRGRRTIAAIRQFQAAHGLQVDGIVGPKTGAKLFNRKLASPDIAEQLPWMSEANRLIGVQETPGKANNPTIIRWARDMGLLDYRDDETPWCGLFVAHCIASQLPEAPISTQPLMARAWLGFGRPVSPRYGALLVFWRGS